jgi:hypothetical protein
MNEIKSILMGIDTTKELCDLWYEVIYQKNILGFVLQKLIDTNPSIKNQINDELFKKCKELALVELEEKFPSLRLSHKLPKEQASCEQGSQCNPETS